MASYVDSLAKAFMSKHPEVTVVVSGGGAEAGFSALFDKTVEVVMASIPVSQENRLHAKEKGYELNERFFAWDAVAVIVHSENRVNELSVKQLAAVCSGEITNWKKLGGADSPVTVVMGEPLVSDTTTFIQQTILNGSPFTAKAVQRRYSRNIIKKVAARSDAIGVAPLPKVLQIRSRHPVKLLGIKKDDESQPIHPSSITVMDRRYPLIRPLYLYTDGKTAGKPVAEFVEYCAVYGLAGKTAMRND